MGVEAVGKGSAPRLELAGFSGSLDGLLAAARAREATLAGLSLPALADQLEAALAAASAASLAQKADWVTMAAWLLLLRSNRLISAPEPPAAAAPPAERGSPQAAALAAALERLPQLGHDSFARGQPEPLGLATIAAPDIDVVEFLWACLDLFDDPESEPPAEPPPPQLRLHAVADAAARIRRTLATTPRRRLDQLLPPPHTPPEPPTRRRSAWTSTFTAILELTRQGEATLQQDTLWTDIHVSSASHADERGHAGADLNPNAE